MGSTFVEDSRRVEADTRLHGKGIVIAARSAPNGVHARGVAEEAAAAHLAIHDGRGAAEFEVDRSDRMLQEFARGANERGDVVADHLCDDGRPVGFSVTERRMCFSSRDVA